MVRPVHLRSALALCFSMSSLGCDSELVVYTDTPDALKYPIAAGNDDGVVRVIRALLPAQAQGQVFSDSTELTVGNLSDGTNVMSHRTLLRFDMATYSYGDVTLNLKCTAEVGSPTAVAIYAVNDFGHITDTGTDDADVTSYWSLPDSGTLVGTIYPSSPSWSTVQIARSVLASRRSADGFLSLVVTYDTKALPGNYYTFASREYAATPGSSAAYLQQNAIPTE